MACIPCGQKRLGTAETRAREARRESGTHDPTRAVFAAAKVQYEVVTSSAVPRGSGRHFSTKHDAVTYARRTGGILRAV